MAPESKTCSACHVDLPLSEFNRVRSGEEKRRAACKTCQQNAYRSYVAQNRDLVSRRRRAYKCRVRFQMTVEQVEALYASVDHRCQACGTHADDALSLVIDHDHACCPGEFTCGKCVRGVLCYHCNLALGYLKDNPSHINGLLAYMEGSHG